MLQTSRIHLDAYFVYGSHGVREEKKTFSAVIVVPVVCVHMWLGNKINYSKSGSRLV